MLVTGATVGVVKMLNGTGDLDDRYAIYAFGKAEFVGLPGVTVSGTLRVRINQTGGAVNRIITLPGHAGRRRSPVNLPATDLEVFEVGVDAQRRRGRQPRS